MIARMRHVLTAACCLAVIASAASCSTEPTEATTTFYDRTIAPTLTQSCATSPSGSLCHVTADDRGNALGNLSLDSYADLILRRDLLIDYGPYGLPNLLLKSVPPYQMRLSSWDGEVEIITTDIPHAGGSILDRTSPSFLQLLRWIERGAMENNSERVDPEVELMPCSTVLGTEAAFDPSSDPADADFATFRDRVAPVLAESCSAGNCHGNSSNSLYLTCGATQEQLRWNYFAASGYVSVDATASEILRRTLAPNQGGTYHEGGAIFPTTSAPGYQAILAWAEQRGGPSHIPTEAGFDFFARRVQPMLAKKGCMIVGCHSPAMFHDYRLRGGSGGHFGLPATRKNYELTLEQLAVEAHDVNLSRLVRKNLDPGTQGGLLHRGGALFARGAVDPTACDATAAANGPLDEQDPYCVIRAWYDLEKQERLGGRSLTGLVYIKRPPTSGHRTTQDWATYRGGSDLLRRAATLDADGSITVDDTEQSLLAGCGLDAATVDLRRPAVSWDAERLAFAARSSASEPFRVYVIDSAGCSVEPTIDAPATNDRGDRIDTNGELVHNFDPAFTTDGRLVFASTRGNIMNTAAFSYQGPQRTPADPSKLNANLYILEQGRLRQLTFVLNQELYPAFMSDGRLIFTAEKRAPGFYQLAGRRQNIDGGDYHPLFGQRGSIGYNQYTESVELIDKNLAAIYSDLGASHGGGALGIVNRSIGIDQISDRPEDYPHDPAAMTFANPAFFQRSISFPDRRATGRITGTDGAYRSPYPLPNGNVMVGYAAGVTDLSSYPSHFSLVEVDPLRGGRRVLVSDAQDIEWGVAVFPRQERPVFHSRPDEANGNVKVYTDAARAGLSEVTILDVPIMGSLLFQNTRGGRPLTANQSPLGIYESLPPEPGVTSLDGGGAFITTDDFGRQYVRRRLMGVVVPHADGSVKFQIPGGMPIVLAPTVHLADDSAPRTRFQREEMQFYPGEWAHQGFRKELFNGLCGTCHGSVSGLEKDSALNPDVLTAASRVAAKEGPAAELRPQGSSLAPPFD